MENNMQNHHQDNNDCSTEEECEKRCPTTYPEVTIDMPSRRDVACLTGVYAGAVSETTAILQYIFYHYVAEKYDKYYQNLFLDVAINEMRHQELLGETIVKLGGVPYYASNNTFWSGRMVDYHTNLAVMLQNSIKSEYEAIEMYQRAIKCVDNYSIKELLEAIIADEKAHICLFKKALCRMQENNLN